MTESTNTKERLTYIVRFEKASHHCANMRDALEFAEHMNGNPLYGKPLEVIEDKVVSVITLKTVHEF